MQRHFDEGSIYLCDTGEHPLIFANLSLEEAETVLKTLPTSARLYARLTKLVAEAKVARQDFQHERGSKYRE